MNVFDIASAIIMPEATGTVTDVLGATEVSETIELVGWGTFEELSGFIPQRLFGEMVKKALPVVKEYHSDLYHDAMFIRDNVKGETSFPFLVRYHGTHTGRMALGMADIERTSDTSILYDVRLHNDNRRWFVTFTVLDKADALAMLSDGAYADDMSAGQE